ncbi:MAG: 3-hydroxyacyl-ACP dehydratase FabZ [Fusobacteriaceae bacterium]|nr:3-hydroxyacyl-ACP dehydratase FabZ [Fusobacteriaceae bacterium]MBN2838847.1 3-hydroxyacyl-ACP dehydratase FabZ [Fusobacteriaceae bacterium]
MLNTLEIMERLPHRYPFLLVDRVIDINEEKTKIIAYKNVTINEQFFNGHFPGHPIMPGVLVIEGLAQALGVLVMGDLKDSVPYYASIDNCKFKAPVTPGDKLVYEVEILKIKGKMVKAQGVAKVDGKIVAQADIMCALMPK